MNMSSFLGPLYPALVKVQLGGDAAAYGAIEAFAVAGGILGGAFAGTIERRLGAGRQLVLGWIAAGLCTIATGASTWLPATALLQVVLVFGLTAGSISLGALTQTLIPEAYLGRVAGITRALNVISIPASALIGGKLADSVGVAPLFVAGGLWIFGVAILAWLNKPVQTARI